MMASSPICLLSKDLKTKSWLWHRHLSHLNFGAINHLARHGLVRGLPKLNFEKDHLCSACAMGKSKMKPHKPKSEDTNQEKLYLLHMDLCGPMRVASVNGKKSKDEAPDFIIKFLKMIQLRLQVPVRRIRTDNGTEFVNQTLREYYEKVDISHETSVARSPQQNGVIERRNPPEVIPPIAEVVAPKPVALTGSTSSTTIDPKENHDLDVSYMNNDPFFGIPILENDFEASSSLDIIPTIVHTAAPNSEHNSQSPKGSFNQSKYALESLKKYGMESNDLMDTPMVEKSKLDEDPQEKSEDPHTIVEWWAPLSYADADHAGCQDTRRSTSGSIQNWRDLPRDIPLDSVVVLRCEKRSKSHNKGKVPTEMELVLEQTQQEHQSDTQVITVKMEILLEPTSNKPMVEHAEYDESNAYVLERFNTTAKNPVKEILLKLNLPDYRSILTDLKVTPTKHGRMKKPYSSTRFIANCFIKDSHKDGHGVVSAQCSGDMQGLMEQCASHITNEVEGIISMEKSAFIAQACGNPLVHGTRCGSYIVP
ncbi:retrovirus-related pol polyprotein from transposon TNT 1-94 [Tanacetum coccineum]